MIKAFAITDQGIEKSLVDEINELVKAKGIAKDSCVIFDVKNDEELFKFTYMTQESDRVGLLLCEFEFNNFDDLINKTRQNLTKELLSDWAVPGTTFRVVCDRRGEHNFSSVMADQEIGAIILDVCHTEFKTELKVDFKTPNTIFLCFVKDNKAYIGIDFCGRDLSKRQYRIFTNQAIINAKLACALARFSGYSEKQKLLDINCGCGIIPIEIALWKRNISASFYNKDFSFKKIPRYQNNDWDSFFKKIDDKRETDKIEITGLDPLLRNVEASKKNAKLGGVDKLISFSKMDVEWLGAKIEDETIDLVISRISGPSQRVGESKIRKEYEELFIQASYFLKKKAKMCLMSENLVLLRSMVPKGFKILKEERFCAGKLEYEVVLIEKE